MTSDPHGIVPATGRDDVATASLEGDADVADVHRDVRRALDARDWARAVQLVGAHWSALLDEPGQLLDEALRLIPLDAFELDARAAAVRDIRLHSAADAVDRMLGSASLPDADDLDELEALARSDRALSLLSVAASRMIALRVRGRFPRAVRLASLVERFSRIAAVHRPGLVASRVPAALLQAGITRGLADDLAGAVLSLRDAYERSGDSRVDYVQRDAAGKAALFLALDGDIGQASAWLARHDAAPAVDGWFASRIALTADTARAIVGIESLRRDDAECALRMLEQPVNAEQGWGPAVTYARARHALVWGDRLGTLQSVRADKARFDAWLAEGSTLGPLLTHAEVELLLSLRQDAQAQRAAADHADHHIARLTRARLALAAGDAPLAARRAAEALGVSRTTRERLGALATHAAARAALPVAGEYSDLAASVRERGLLSTWLAVPAAARSALGADLADTQGAREVAALDDDRVRITPQQRRVLEGLDRGMSLQAIASQSHLSINTVKSHARALYQRLGATTRDEAVAAAYDLGLL